MESYTKNIVKIIYETCDNKVIDVSQFMLPLTELELDSLDYVTVVMALEDKYNIEIPQTSDQEIWSIADLAIFLKSKLLD